MNRKVVERHALSQSVAGEGRCLYENASWQAYLWMAERDDRTILRGGQGKSRPALCAHAWNTEHAGAVFPDSGGAKYQEAGGLFLSRFSSLSNTLPLRLYLNAGVCQWSEILPQAKFPRQLHLHPAVTYVHVSSLGCKHSFLGLQAFSSLCQSVDFVNILRAAPNGAARFASQRMLIIMESFAGEASLRRGRVAQPPG